jgi:GTPase
VIDSFKDKSESLSVIEASIVVSRHTQKGIIIGKGGAKLKEVGTIARQKLEAVSKHACSLCVLMTKRMI